MPTSKLRAFPDNGENMGPWETEGLILVQDEMFVVLSSFFGYRRNEQLLNWERGVRPLPEPFRSASECAMVKEQTLRRRQLKVQNLISTPNRRFLANS